MNEDEPPNKPPFVAPLLALLLNGETGMALSENSLSADNRIVRRVYAKCLNPKLIRLTQLQIVAMIAVLLLLVLLRSRFGFAIEVGLLWFSFIARQHISPTFVRGRLLREESMKLPVHAQVAPPNERVKRSASLLP